MTLKSEQLYQERLAKETEGAPPIPKKPAGEDIIVTSTRRAGQDFFRVAVIASYNTTCCISGVKASQLLEACHIIGWAEDRELRTDPCNGLCMNVFFHRAYDNHLMGITPDGIIHISPTLIDNVSEENFKSYLVKLENRKIHMPSHFYPNPDYLAARYEQFGKA